MSDTVLISTIGVATVVISILVKIIGLPDQFRKNFKRKSTFGLSMPFFLFGLLSYVLWTIYGLLKSDWVVVIGQGVGVLTMGAVVYQIWLYRGKK